jgi:BNR repeat-like domain
MALLSAALFGSVVCLAVAAEGQSETPPWQANTPIVTVKKELYKVHPRPRTAALVSVASVGPGLELQEAHAFETQSDVGDDITARWSLDNGRTWSDVVPVQPSNNVTYAGTTVWEGGGAAAYDPTSALLVGFWLRQIERGGIYHCFTYIRTSGDLGRTWSEPKQLTYEPGDPFDPADPLKATFVNHNEAYLGNNILVRRDGTLLVCLAHANAPDDPRNDQRPWRMGSVLFLGRWDPARREYTWTPGARVTISPDDSARGLMEPEVAELVDGRLLVVWRGSTHGWDGSVAKLAGRKFFSISTDGGRTLTPPTEWKYDDGSSFYSPSSYHRMIRHSVTDKLYWIGNITSTPPRGNSPRYPLVIAEVDETRAALRKSTVTVIDDRQPNQGPDVQFSNFSLYEDRETHALVLYLTTYGQEPDPAAWATADSYRYTVTLRR